MVLAAPTAGRCKAFVFFLKPGRKAAGTRGHSSTEAFGEVFKEADNDLALELGQLRRLSLSGSLFFPFCILRYQPAKGSQTDALAAGSPTAAFRHATAAAHPK